MEAFTAFILAGGKSTRMGSDKAFLDLHGQPLIAHALDLARSITQVVKIVGDPQKFSTFGPVVDDIYPARGPLGGIHAALGSTSTTWNLVLGVDLPFIQSRFLNYLVTKAQSTHSVVTVPSANGHLQPLCAVYRKEFCQSADRALSAGQNRIDALFGEVLTHIIQEPELTTSGFSPAMFRSLNTPLDWHQARQEFADQS
jgi:molybdenum cofactor guanylyltransferase